ncbi:MAG: LamG domain-containing protein [Planctomycetes bacterium]|nr:LamG domain-containing protein [Planctomycetota bacterium]
MHGFSGWVGSALLAVCGSASAQYSSIAYEDFEYPTGNLQGQDGGPGWAGAWRSTTGTVSLHRVYLGKSMLCSGAGNGSFRTLDTASWPYPQHLQGGDFGADGTSVWVRFHMERDAASDHQYGGLSLWRQGVGEQMFLGNPGRTGALGIYDFHGGRGPWTIPGSSPVNLSWLVCRIDFRAGDEHLRLWLNPSISRPSGAADLDVMVADFRFDELRLESGDGASSVGFYFDELELEMEAETRSLDLRPQGDSYLAASHAAAFVPSSGLTVEAWVILDSSLIGRPTIVRKNPVPFMESYNLRIEGGSPQWGAWTAGGNNAIWARGTQMPLGRPVHLAGTWDGTTARLYMDGVLLGSNGSFPGALRDTGGELRIGKGDDNGLEAFVGAIDEVRLWSRARTASEIADGMRRELNDGSALVAAWHLNGSFVDSVGSRNAGARGTARFGPEVTSFARALRLAPSGSFLEVPDAPELVPTSGLTVEAWIQVDSPSSGRPTIVRKNPTPNQESYNLRIELGSPQWQVFTAGGRNIVWPTGTALPIGRPVHLAGTWDGTIAKLYMDGVLLGSAFTHPGPMVRTGGALRIGKGDNNGAEEFEGRIDEVRIWSFARTEGEIGSTKNRELCCIPGLIASYAMEGNLLDGSGNHHAAAMGPVEFVTEFSSHLGLATRGVARIGAPSSVCATPATMVITSIPWISNAHLALGCIDVRGPAAGVLVLSSSALTTPINLLGVQLWMDPAAPIFAVASTVSLANGVVRFATPVPNDALLVGGRVAAQFLWADVCGPQGISATDGVELTILSL